VDFPLPPNLPVPIDDGACAHLTGSLLPSIALTSTSNTLVDPSIMEGLVIIFCYPRTGTPGEIIPEEWDMIPGARGCTPQACAFRDTFVELRALGVNHVFGLSTQDTAFQTEVKDRLHLPYDILSDKELRFVKALKLPTFDWKGDSLVKRLAIAAVDGKIVRVWYPVFPSDRNAHDVIEWLRAREVTS